MARIIPFLRLSNNLGIWDPGEMEKHLSFGDLIKNNYFKRDGLDPFHPRVLEAIFRLGALKTVLAWYLIADHVGSEEVKEDLSELFKNIPRSQVFEESLSLYAKWKESESTDLSFRAFVGCELPVNVNLEVRVVFSKFFMKDWRIDLWEYVSSMDVRGLKADEMQVFDEVCGVEHERSCEEKNIKKIIAPHHEPV